MQQNERFRQTIRRAYARYDSLMEKQGFTIVLVVCVLVIVLSALYTFYFREAWSSQEPVLDQTVTAGGTQNAQTLMEAQTLIESQGAKESIVPTEAPFRFTQPVAGFLDRDFSMTEPQHFPKAHYWRLHPGIDLQAAYGAPVACCADGRVLNVWNDNEMGLCIRIAHDHGYQTVYAGLSDASYVQPGDPVALGQTLGHVGNGVLAESDAQPHLHFEVWRGDTAVDPIELFLGLTK